MRTLWTKNLGGGLSASLFRTSDRFILQWDYGVVVQAHKLSEMDISEAEIVDLVEDLSLRQRIMERFELMAADHFELMLNQE